MAQSSNTKSKSAQGGRSRRSSDGRSSSQKPEKYRFAQNVDGEETAAEREYRTYATAADEQAAGDPDVLLAVPVVKVDSIHLQVEDLQAHVSLQAKVLELVDLNVGVDVHLGKVRLDIKGVEAQALLKVRLDHVAAVVDRVFTTVDRNPDLVESIGKAVKDVGRGAGHAVDETGDAVEETGEGAGSAVEDIGKGTGQAVGEIGEGAGQAAGDLDQALGKAAGAAGQLGQGGDGGGGLGDVAGLVAGDHSTRAKEAAKLTVKEVGATAKEKVKELGDRRRHRKAEQHDATDRAYELADELGVDLDEVKGSGADGRITVKDVRTAGSG